MNTFFTIVPPKHAKAAGICYDHEALNAGRNISLKQRYGHGTAMGIELLTEEQYRQLQQLGAFDVKTSSWILTPVAIRKLGGALFCDPAV